MPGDDLCPYCRDKDLSGLSTYNKERHYDKCKQRNPYPKLKPRKQTKLGFLPVQKPTESPEPILEPELVEENVSTVVNEGDNSIIPDPPSDDLVDDDDNILVVDDEGNNNIADYPLIDMDDDEIVLVGEVASESCQGFQPLLTENFYENFAFQLLPTMPHITLCGSSFHHVSCTDAHFELQPGSEEMVNTQCSSLKSDEKLSAILERGNKNIVDIHIKTNNIFLTHSQLSEKCNTLRKERNLLQLELKNKCKRMERLNSVLAMHKRFMVFTISSDPG